MRMRSRLMVALFSALIVLALAAPHAAADDNKGRGRSMVVSTDKGDVRGVRQAGVDTFRGIPFAAPPVGELRWRSPQPALAWTGVRESETTGRDCPQLTSAELDGSGNEDCLVLNVQRPAQMGQHGRLPVFVFIHGGGLTGWSSSMFDGAALVAETGIIVVTLNYRLGVLGFLAHPALAPESGNYGFEDQQSALRWVHDNIAGFGGDPGRVTLGGHSSGGGSVCAHLVSEVSKPLFQQAVMLSSGCGASSMEDAQRAGVSFAEAVGCGDPTTADQCLRALPVAELLDQQNDPTSEWFADLIRGTPELGPDPFDSVQSGNFKKVPVLIGATRDEFRSFTFEDAVRRGEQPPEFRGFTQTQYRQQLTDDFGFLDEPSIDAIAGEYPWPVAADEYTAAYLISAIRTDLTFVAGGCFGRLLTRQFAGNNDAHTYAYEFNHRDGPGFLPNPTQFEFGAGHGSELAYLFPGFSKGRIAPLFDKQEKQLASSMKQWLGSFVTNGKPRSEHNPSWQPYDAKQRTLSIRAGNQSAMVADAQIVAEHHCNFWYDLFGVTEAG